MKLGLLGLVLVLTLLVMGCVGEDAAKISAADMAVSLTSRAFGYELKHRYADMVVTLRSEDIYVVSGPVTRPADGRIFTMFSVVSKDGNTYYLQEAQVDGVTMYLRRD